MEQFLSLAGLFADNFRIGNFDIMNQHVAQLPQGGNLTDSFLIQQIQSL